MEIRIELPGVKLGVVEADGLHVVPVDLGLAKLMDEVSERKRSEFTVESLAEAPAIRAVAWCLRQQISPRLCRHTEWRELVLRRASAGPHFYRVLRGNSLQQ